VALNPDVIITGGGDFMAQALQRVTKTVPIISPYGDDPVGAGLVASLARPGGNVTGFLAYTGPEFETKRLQLLREAVPNATRIAFLGMKQIWESQAGQQVQDAARTLGLTLIHVEHAPDSYADAFAAMTRDRPDALFVAYHPVNYANRNLIVEFAFKQRIPGMFPYREAVKTGGLMSYSVSTTDLFRRAAGLVDKVLKGAKPADIPVERPTKLEFWINLKTAKLLGLDIPEASRHCRRGDRIAPHLPRWLGVAQSAHRRPPRAPSRNSHRAIRRKHVMPADLMTSQPKTLALGAGPG
jgi:putative tryptophan/tyrosine transport system substrate-binding protein